MAKRFTDTDKFIKTWYKKLPAPYKLLWEYILSQCDCAGIWLVEADVAQARVGTDAKISIKKAIEYFNEGKLRVVAFHDNEKWLIVDFVKFQYGILRYTNKAHRGVIQRLIDNGLYDFYDQETGEFKGLSSPIEAPLKDLSSPFEGPKDKDKDIYINSINKVENHIDTAQHKSDLKEKRKKQFYDSLIPYVDIYGKEMIREFYDYWSEDNKSHTQFRKELQTTWDLKRRLARWARNYKGTLPQADKPIKFNFPTAEQIQQDKAKAEANDKERVKRLYALAQKSPKSTAAQIIEVLRKNGTLTKYGIE